MENVACICRVSTDKQELDNQRHVLETYCSAKGYDVIRWFGEIETAGKPTSNLLNEILHEGRVGTATAAGGRKYYRRVIVVRADRLPTFRTGIGPVFELVKVLAANGLAIESVAEPWLATTGPMSELLLSVIAWMAQQERTTLIERTRAGMERKARQNREKALALAAAAGANIADPGLDLTPWMPFCPARGKDKKKRKTRSDTGKSRRKSLIPIMGGTPENEGITLVNMVQ
jgi:DNA invertase Pin-like site-specific DNA recombinase